MGKWLSVDFTDSDLFCSLLNQRNFLKKLEPIMHGFVVRGHLELLKNILKGSIGFQKILNVFKRFQRIPWDFRRL